VTADQNSILEHKDDLKAFRAAVREWTRKTAPPEKAHTWVKAEGADQVAIQKWWMMERNKVGLATPHWPSEYGGADLGLMHQIIISDEFAKANSPGSDYFTISLNHIPGTLIPFGSEYQKKKYLPTVPAGTIWCQGFSEPGAGSDLAALRTQAVLDGDHYVVNGQKIWSSISMYAKYCILLVRTSSEGKKQQGITYLLLDMETPGLEVRPIKKSTGEKRFAELFFTDVRIPVIDRVGEENQGWTVAQATLSSERGVLRFEYVERLLQRVEADYAEALRTDAAWLHDAQLRREFMTLFAELQAGRREIRALLKEEHGAGWSMTPAFVKLSSSILAQKFGDLQARVRGLYGQIVGIDEGTGIGMYDYLDSYGLTISAGTSEIMRNLIAERGLDLPRG